MAVHDGALFSTTDSDNDKINGWNCANSLGGGWWFIDNCYKDGCFLTGNHTDNQQMWERLLWHDGTGLLHFSTYDYYQDVDMMIRPKTCPHNHSECTKEESE